MKYEFLNNLSGATLLVVVTVVFSLLFETKYTLKTYLKSFIPFITILLGVNFYVIFKYGFSSYAQLTFFTATLPSLIYFFIVSKYKNGKFFFTFCLVDTSVIWFATFVALIDFLLGAEGLFNSIIRFISAPIIIYTTIHFFRRAFMSLLHTVQKGWWLLTGATGVVYALLLVLTGYPVSLRERPDDIFLAIIIAIFLPIVYLAMFYILFAQKKLLEMRSSQHIFSAQCSMIEERAKEMSSFEEKTRIEKHDIRHKLKIIEELTINDEKEEILKYLGTLDTSLNKASIKHYCNNPILDAILSSYFRKAEENDIKIKTDISLPGELGVSETELATVFANIIENAINACVKLPEEKRYISFVAINRPSLMFELKNPYTGEVVFDKNGLPVSQNNEHGFGAKSIAAFCKKYGAVYSCSANDGIFSIKIGV